MLAMVYLVRRSRRFACFILRLFSFGLQHSEKQFVETKYKIYPNQTSNSQLARAITHGAEKGIFVLPKGHTRISRLGVSELTPP